MDNHYHKVTDFVADHTFIKWVKIPDAPEKEYWENFLKAYPDKKQHVLEARQMVLLLSQDNDELEKWELDEIWQNLTVARQEYTEPGKNSSHVLPFQIKKRRRFLVAAATSILLLVAGIFYINFTRPETVEFATNYGEQKEIQLPDNSVVRLNGHSRISFSEKWDEDEAREVALEGEAFFKVTHQANNQKFLVHTPAGLQVEVLGTEFCVTNRKGFNRVVLASGKVRLQLPEKISAQPVEMKPGQLVEVSDQTQTIISKLVKPELYTSWKEDKLIFDNTTLNDIAFIVEHTYGYPVIFGDSTIGNQKMTASLEIEKLDDLLMTLSETFDLKIEKQNGKVMITNN